MVISRTISRLLALPMALVMFLNGSLLPATAHAAMVTTEQVIQQSAEVHDRERVRSFLAREDVRRQMEALGVDPNEAAARVANLSGKELQQIVNRLDELPAGQGSVVGPIVGAIVLIFIVLLITDLLCLTSVFPFTRCVR